MHYSLFVAEHDERNDPGSKLWSVEGSLQDDSRQSVYWNHWRERSFPTLQGSRGLTHTTYGQNLSHKFKVNVLVNQWILWSGLKHVGSHEYVNVPIVVVLDWTTNGRDASEEPGAMSLMYGAFSRGIPRRCLVHRHRQLVAFEQQQLVDFFKGHAEFILTSDKSTFDTSCKV